MKIKKLSDFTLNENTNFSYEEKIQIYYNTFSFFLEKKPTFELIIQYLNQDYTNMQDFIVSNLKDDMFWSTGIGVMDAIDLLIKEAHNNGNFKGYTPTEFDQEFGTEYKEYLKTRKRKDFNL